MGGRHTDWAAAASLQKRPCQCAASSGCPFRALPTRLRTHARSPFFRGPLQMTASSGFGSMNPMLITPRFSCSMIMEEGERQMHTHPGFPAGSVTTKGAGVRCTHRKRGEQCRAGDPPGSAAHRQRRGRAPVAHKHERRRGVGWGGSCTGRRPVKEPQRREAGWREEASESAWSALQAGWLAGRVAVAAEGPGRRCSRERDANA